MHCKNCGVWIIQSLDKWTPGRCHNCGEFPPFDLPPDQLRELQTNWTWTYGGSFSSNGDVPPAAPAKPRTAKQMDAERLERMGIFRTQF